MRPLTEEEKSALYTGLSVRKNVIETGDYRMDAATAKKMGKDKELQALSVDQMKLVILSYELMSALLEGRIFIKEPTNEISGIQA